MVSQLDAGGWFWAVVFGIAVALIAFAVWAYLSARVVEITTDGPEVRTPTEAAR